MNSQVKGGKEKIKKSNITTIIPSSILQKNYDYSPSPLIALHIPNRYLHFTILLCTVDLPEPMSGDDAVSEFQEGLILSRRAGGRDAKGGDADGTTTGLMTLL